MQQQQAREMSDEEAIMKIAAAMKDNVTGQEEKQTVHTFLFNIATAKDTTKIGNLRDDKEVSEIGLPLHSVMGSKDMALISDKIMGNDFFKEYFEQEAENTLATSLSREGFLVRQGTTQTKQVADITRRRKINKGWFGRQKIEESGGDTTTQKI
jgi:hypothetical protein